MKNKGVLIDGNSWNGLFHIVSSSSGWRESVVGVTVLGTRISQFEVSPTWLRLGASDRMVLCSCPSPSFVLSHIFVLLMLRKRRRGRGKECRMKDSFCSLQNIRHVRREGEGCLALAWLIELKNVFCTMMHVNALWRETQSVHCTWCPVKTTQPVGVTSSRTTTTARSTMTEQWKK